jgi:predicted membrane protein
VSVSPVSRPRTAETVAGLMASLALFVSLIGVVHRPVRVIPAAIVVAIVAAVIGGRHARLAGVATAVTVVAFVVGMTIASATGRPLW